MRLGPPRYGARPDPEVLGTGTAVAVTELWLVSVAVSVMAAEVEKVASAEKVLVKVATFGTLSVLVAVVFVVAAAVELEEAELVPVMIPVEAAVLEPVSVAVPGTVPVTTASELADAERAPDQEAVLLVEEFGWVIAWPAEDFGWVTVVALPT